jgi:hypothetical protein
MALGTADQIPDGKFPDTEDTVKFHRKHCGTTVTAAMYETIRSNEIVLKHKVFVFDVATENIVR